jgi:perosamine synthetase
MTKRLSKIDGIELPKIKPYAKTNWHIYAIRIPHSIDAGWFEKALNAEGIGAYSHYTPLHTNPFFKYLGYKEGDFPISEKIYKTLIRLPIFAGMLKEDADDVAEAVGKIMGSVK